MNSVILRIRAGDKLLEWEIGHVQHGYTHKEESMYGLAARRIVAVLERRGS